jgi:hypothetical protein
VRIAERIERTDTGQAELAWEVVVDVFWPVLGLVFAVFVGLLVALSVLMLREDRRAAARLRGPVGSGERRVWISVAALLARERADVMPMYPGPPISRVRPVQGAATRHRHAGGA